MGAAKSDFGPRVSAYGNWEEDRPSFAGSGGNNWVAGVQISIDILPLSKRAQLARESAAKQKIDAQVAAIQQHRAARSEPGAHSPADGSTRLETARAAMDQSAESLRILKNRYGAGLATITDLLRAEDAERQSQSNYWHAVYGNAMAYSRTTLRDRDPDSRCGGGIAMKNVLWASLLAVSAAMLAGCHGGEPATTPATVANRAGASGRKPAAAGARESAIHRHGSCTANRGGLRAGDGPHPAGAGARRRHRSGWANAGGARRCGTARRGGAGAGWREGGGEPAGRRANECRAGSEHAGALQATASRKRA